MLNGKHKFAVKIWLCITLLALLFSTLSPGTVAAAPGYQGDDPPPADPPPVVEPQLLAQLDTNENIGYIIHFSERPNLDLAASLDWDVRGRFVVTMLENTASKTQQRVRLYLESRAVSYQAFWVDNIILVNASDQLIFNGLLDFTEIDSLRARRHPTLHEPDASLPSQTNPALEAEPNLLQVNADQVWGLGYDGAGIVVANIDTGVRYTHETLVDQYRGNLGDGNFDHNYNWWDPILGGSQSIPNDFHGHGSHTMGIILGDDGGDNQIGMAPGASWIACQAFEGSDSELLECGQFLLAPWDLNGQNLDPTLRPHVINNSWGDCEHYTDTWYKGIVDSW
jgi:subtilisin family serine protease